MIKRTVFLITASLFITHIHSMEPDAPCQDTHWQKFLRQALMYTSFERKIETQNSFTQKPHATQDEEESLARLLDQDEAKLSTIIKKSYDETAKSNAEAAIRKGAPFAIYDYNGYCVIQLSDPSVDADPSDLEMAQFYLSNSAHYKSKYGHLSK